ncbi:putative glycosyl hydrolase [Actinoplanes missouriensis 431]|uniref:Putative glycosyl hydrolase n=1 Tax=Actinoplanes missouriensis (strain ATCC 14538 / DSM 43046 / CBS 188.64 / JCM 3121 / NBRC 102363 / NCIMB 12654 / NRRL B-3342 / UNCC 431) TaxID=512565 RepID=I0HHP4_ACTM4|nr:carbohydrate-binding protein [Actinoplanes missouriensis]BAL92531.1 putative glycosyl hydrolase [Actinoplanes missouriensis 431]
MKSVRLLRSLTAAAVFASGLAVTAAPAAAATVTRTVFSDGFDGDRGAAPDPAKWSPTLEAWLDGAGALALDDPLRTATTFTQKSGHAEAKIKLRRTSGAWRALGVLDESGRIPAGQVEVLADDGVSDDQFHTYAIDWTPTSMVWSVDGTDVIRFTPAESGRPFFLALNLNSAGRRADTMLVDAVRVTVRVTVASKPWKKFTTYKAGQYVTYKGGTYRVKERHTSLPGWQPTLVPALFTKI